MELIYFILTILIRFSPFVRRMSDMPTRAKAGRSGQVAMVSLWLPGFGWVSVSVRYFPNVRWLHWRVVDILAMSHHVSDRRKQEQESFPHDGDDEPIPRPAGSEAGPR